jgi:Na+/H+-dicarboxylate symporter/ABC-type amino acid transport substrate-binding protein
MQLSTKVLIGLVLGIVAGFFFGEQVAFLKVAGDVFIMSLQITVLPYIIVSLVAGLGGLSIKNAVVLGRKCGSILLMLWAIGLAMVLLATLSFPNWQSASFFSTSLIEKKTEVSYLSLYIPSNIFYSLSSNTVPAVVVFSVALGIALIGVKDKEILLRTFATVGAALGRITNALVGLAPFGVFALIASALGTMRFDELARLQVYMVTYAAVATVLTFWILPSLVTTLTPFRYKDLVGPARTALITAFATGNVFVVLPVLTDLSKELLRSNQGSTSNMESSIDVIIPTSFSFPNLGKILTLLFVPFAGWFANTSIPPSKYPSFAVIGLFSFFGDPITAIPSLLNIFGIPTDTFRFFPIADNLVGARFGTLLAAMYTLVLAVLGASAISGIIQIHWRKLARSIAFSLLAAVIVIGAVRALFEYGIQHTYKENEVLVSMEMLHQYPEAKIFSTEIPAPVTVNSGTPHLEDIRQRGFIRVGYFDAALPFAFVNKEGRLVGFDIEMAYILAKDMGVRLELVRIDRSNAPEALNNRIVDMIMSGMVVTLDRARELELSTPYLKQTLAFVVKDNRLEDFNSREQVQKLKKVKLAVFNSPYYLEKVKNYLPQAEIVVINSPEEFFSRNESDIDAFVYSAEAGSAWSLIHPEYTVAIPYPDVPEVPLAYAFSRENYELKNYIDLWIDLKKRDRTIDGLYDQWILGKNAVRSEPRWSVIRNVLHWIN